MEMFCREPRIHFIAADDPINSYDLLNDALAVVVHTSTFGIEAAIKRRVVITSSNSYYSGLGFVWAARSKHEYFSNIFNAVHEKYSVTKPMSDDALLCYYLTQCCNWISTEFNPINFNWWVNKNLEELYQCVEVQDMINSINNNVPVSLLIYERKINLKHQNKVC